MKKRPGAYVVWVGTKNNPKGRNYGKVFRLVEYLGVGCMHGSTQPAGRWRVEGPEPLEVMQGPYVGVKHFEAIGDSLKVITKSEAVAIRLGSPP